jgi:hypothetical protein
VWRRKEGEIVCSLRRQGVFNLHAPGQPVHCNMGCWIETASQQRWSSSHWNTSELDVNEDAQGACTVRGRFIRVEDQLPLTRGSVAFHAVTDWLLRWPSLAEATQRLIKRRKITARREAPATFERSFEWNGQDLLVRDTITTLSGCPALSALGPVDDIDVHSPSARLGGAPPSRITVDRRTAERWAARLSQQGVLRLETVYSPDANGFLTLKSIGELPAGETS